MGTHGSSWLKHRLFGSVTEDVVRLARCPVMVVKAPIPAREPPAPERAHASTVAPIFRVEGDQLHLAFWHSPKIAEPPPSSLTVERRSNLLAVRMTLPPAGFAIYQAAPALERLGPRPPPDLKPWHPR
jgi:hypothetical protein